MVLLRLFRKNDPYLNVVLIIVLVILRLLFFFWGENDLDNDIQENSYLLKAIINEPLNSSVQLGISTVFIAINTLLINNLIRSNQAFDENNYLAGLIYILITNSSILFFQLNGELVATTCFLLALSLMLSHVKQRASEENIFFTGALIGLSVLFYSPMSVFLLITLLIYVFYTRTISRRYLLSAFGFCFPFIIFYSISLFSNEPISLGFFFKNFFSSSLGDTALVSWAFILIPVLLSLFKMLSSFSGIKMTNHQIHFHRVMFLVTLVAFYMLFADAQGTGFVLIFSIPATYFLSKSLLEINKNWVRDAVFILLLLHLAAPYLVAAYF